MHPMQLATEDFARTVERLQDGPNVARNNRALACELQTITSQLCSSLFPFLVSRVTKKVLHTQSRSDLSSLNSRDPQSIVRSQQQIKPAG